MRSHIHRIAEKIYRTSLCGAIVIVIVTRTESGARLNTANCTCEIEMIHSRVLLGSFPGHSIVLPLLYIGN